MDNQGKKLCEICNSKPAELTVVQYIGGNMKELKVCHSCALKVGISDQLTEDKGTFSTEYELSHNCPFCEWQLKDFMNTGLLGCPYCFVEFEHEIRMIIEQFHGVEIDNVSEQTSDETRKIILKTQLEKAITEERFEDAAKIRDMIKKLEQ